MKDRLQKALEAVIEKIGDFRPEIAIVPGSGWDQITACIENPLTVEYAQLPSFPRATFHTGVF